MPSVLGIRNPRQTVFPAALFNGASAYLHSDTDDAISFSAPEGTISFWLKILAQSGVESILQFWNGTIGSGFLFYLEDTPSNQILFKGFSGAGAQMMRRASYFRGYERGIVGNWIHLMYAWSVPLNIVRAYVCDTDSGFEAVSGNVAVSAASTELFIAQNLACEMHGLWADFVFMNPAVLGNRRKFITADRRPVNLGSNGENPTGTAPWLFLNGTDWNANKGSGIPDFTGTLSYADRNIVAKLFDEWDSGTVGSSGSPGDYPEYIGTAAMTTAYDATFISINVNASAQDDDLIVCVLYPDENYGGTPGGNWQTLDGYVSVHTLPAILFQVKNGASPTSVSLVGTCEWAAAKTFVFRSHTKIHKALASGSILDLLEWYSGRDIFADVNYFYGPNIETTEAKVMRLGVLLSDVAPSSVDGMTELAYEYDATFGGGIGLYVDYLPVSGTKIGWKKASFPAQNGSITMTFGMSSQ